MDEYKLPISVNGIVVEDGKVWLRKNERNEWELPGGRMKPGENPEAAVVRELIEELGFTVSVKNIISANAYNVSNPKSIDNTVLVIIYLCELLAKVGGFEDIGESGPSEFKSYPLHEVTSLNMPVFYKQAIGKAAGNT